jgi:hypothetical protein
VAPGLLAVPLPASHPEVSRYGQRVDAAERAVALGGKVAAVAGTVLFALLVAAGALG